MDDFKNNVLPSTFPCFARSETGWKMLVRNATEVKTVDVVYWRFEPRTITEGGFGFQPSALVVGCEPIPANVPDGFVWHGDIFKPGTSEEDIAKREARVRELLPILSYP